MKYIAFHLPQDFLLIEQENQAYMLFETLYREICDLVRQGHELPEVSEPKLLRHEKNTGVGRHYLNLMKTELRGTP